MDSMSELKACRAAEHVSIINSCNRHQVLAVCAYRRKWRHPVRALPSPLRAQQIKDEVDGEEEEHWLGRGACAGCVLIEIEQVREYTQENKPQ